MKSYTLFFSLLSLSFPTFGAVVELSAGEFSPQSQPLTLASLQQINYNFGGVFANGQSNHSLSSEINEYTLSLIHYDTTNSGLPYLIAGVAGAGQVDQRSNNSSTDGLLDLRFAAACWPIVNAEKGYELGIGISTTVPTGSYRSNQTLNTGENRVRVNGLLGFKLRLTDRISSESFFQYNWVSDNDHVDYAGYRFTLTQAPSYSYSTFLLYQSPYYWQTYIGLEQNEGAAKFLENDLLGKTAIWNGQRDLRWYLGGRMPLTKNWLVSIRYGKTQTIDKGSALEDQWLMRLSYLF